MSSALHTRENSNMSAVAKIESTMPLDASHAASNFYGISQHPSSRQNRQKDKIERNFKISQVQNNEYVSLQHANHQNQQALLLNQTSRSTNITNYDSVHSIKNQQQYYPSTRQSSVYIPNNNSNFENQPQSSTQSSKHLQLTYELHRVNRDQLRALRGIRNSVKYVVCLFILLNILIAGGIVIYILKSS